MKKNEHKLMPTNFSNPFFPLILLDFVGTSISSIYPGQVGDVICHEVGVDDGDR